MEKIILLETSTSRCSAALAVGGEVVAYKEDNTREHASLTAPLVKELLDGQGWKVRDCDAVCVSMGPGSYTGLRVGVSTAKGLCFGAGIPLLALSSLDILCAQARQEGLLPQGCRWIVPMIDARRMEVYTALYTPEGKQVTPIEAKIVDAGSFAGQIGDGPVLFIGDGAGKCREVLTGPNAFFIQDSPKASAMALPAHRAWNEKRFEDIAYFEPFYLKEFVTTVSRKKLF